MHIVSILQSGNTIYNLKPPLFIRGQNSRRVSQFSRTTKTIQGRITGFQGRVWTRPPVCCLTYFLNNFGSKLFYLNAKVYDKCSFEVSLLRSRRLCDSPARNSPGDTTPRPPLIDATVRNNFVGRSQTLAALMFRIVFPTLFISNWPGSRRERKQFVPSDGS